MTRLNASLGASPSLASETMPFPMAWMVAVELSPALSRRPTSVATSSTSKPRLPRVGAAFADDSASVFIDTPVAWLIRNSSSITSDVSVAGMAKADMAEESLLMSSFSPKRSPAAMT